MTVGDRMAVSTDSRTQLSRGEQTYGPFFVMPDASQSPKRECQTGSKLSKP